MEPVEQLRQQRRRWIALAGLVLVAGAIVISTTKQSSEKQTFTDVAAVDVDGSRSMDTTPFELAGPASSDGMITIPGDPIDEFSTTPTLPPTTTTSTTAPIPTPPPDDPICGMAIFVVEGLRLAAGPDGSSPLNLQAAGERFTEAADTIALARRGELAPLESVARTIGRDLPSARDQAEAEAIYNQILTPSDPAIEAVARDFSQHLQDSCPEVISLER